MATLFVPACGRQGHRPSTGSNPNHAKREARWPEPTAGHALGLTPRGEALLVLDFFIGSFLLYQDKRNEQTTA